PISPTALHAALPILGDAVTAWRANPGQIMGVGVVLMLLLLAWIRLAFLIFALFFGAQPPSWELLISSTLLSAEGLPFLVAGTLRSEEHTSELQSREK